VTPVQAKGRIEVVGTVVPDGWRRRWSIGIARRRAFGGIRTAACLGPRGRPLALLEQLTYFGDQLRALSAGACQSANPEQAHLDLGRAVHGLNLEDKDTRECTLCAEFVTRLRRIVTATIRAIHRHARDPREGPTRRRAGTSLRQAGFDAK
jgi:hypothetical protein